jgi:hypothetical protein
LAQERTRVSRRRRLGHEHHHAAAHAAALHLRDELIALLGRLADPTGEIEQPGRLACDVHQDRLLGERGHLAEHLIARTERRSLAALTRRLAR